MRRVPIFLVVLIGWGWAVSFAQQCEIREEIRTLPTYPFSDPDPVPILLRQPKIYPYFAFDGYSNRSVPQDWKVVCLENAYLQVFVLPEVGGKIFGAIDKTTGREFIYRNDALKFRQIALRGPWTSGGIEFNFGVVGHAPTTATPVDYALGKNDDGSVSCVVGAIDLASRTRWEVDIRLSPGKAFFETRSLWTNPTPFHQSCYAWSTAAVAARDDLQYFYPGYQFVPHDPSEPSRPWPVDEKGRDLSWYRNNAFGGSKSHFVMGELADFFGVYWHRDEFGMGHWARYEEMPGRKAWIWALSRAGGIWEGLLTDAHGQYSEPQAGRLLSQSHHEFLQPDVTDTWSEVWFPLHDIGGLVAAGPGVALNLRREGEATRISLMATEALDDELVVSRDGREVLREKLDMRPLEVVNRTVDEAKPGSLQIRIGERLQAGDDPGARRLDRPFASRPAPGRTPEALYLQGVALEKSRDREAAVEKYQACLEREPRHLAALVRLGEIRVRQGLGEEALELARRALEIQPYDAGANYVFGLACRSLGQMVEAQEAFGWAARSLEYRSAAYRQMTELLVLEGSLREALEYTRRALRANRDNLTARELRISVLRGLGRSAEANHAWAALRALSRLDPVAAYEKAALENSPEGWQRFRSAVAGEFPDQTYLELASRYATLGQDSQAIQILEMAPVRPMIMVWQAYLLRDRDPTASAAALARAEQLPARLVFPSRTESIAVLRWAIGENSTSWKMPTYLAFLLWSLGRTDEALALFDRCDQADFAPLLIARAHLRGDDASGMLEDLTMALEAKDGGWRAWHHLLGFLRNRGRFDKAMDAATEALERFPDQLILRMDRAVALWDVGRWQDCVETLSTLQVLPYEGSGEAHDLWVRANLSLALDAMREGRWTAALGWIDASRTYPEHLGAGRPFDPDLRLQDYLASRCHEALGDADQARELLRTIVTETRRIGSAWGPATLVVVLALRDLGERGQADSLAIAWRKARPGDSIVRWHLARLGGDAQAAAALETRLGSGSSVRFWRRIVDYLEAQER